MTSIPFTSILAGIGDVTGFKGRFLSPVEVAKILQAKPGEAISVLNSLFS